MTEKNHVLVLADHYWPAYKAGGPVRSIQNLVEMLTDEFRFTVMTSDRDFGDNHSYTDRCLNQINHYEHTDIIYLTPDKQTHSALADYINQLKPDVVYLNSVFSPRFSIKTLLLYRLGKLSINRLVIAPRGEVSSGALSIKKFKKKAFLWFAYHCGFYQGAMWHATDATEVTDIQNIMGVDPDNIIQAPNLSSSYLPTRSNDNKPQGQIRLIYVSRITPKKQLHFLLEVLSQVNSDIVFDIYGPLEDKEYWKTCSSKIKQLSDNIDVSYKGDLSPESVRDMMANYHAFVLPTLNENFGHVIMEALSAGCPPLLSPNTPWSDLNRYQAGQILPLKSSHWRQAIENLANMSSTDHAVICENAQKAARYYLDNQKQYLRYYRSMFTTD